MRSLGDADAAAAIRGAGPQARALIAATRGRRAARARVALLARWAARIETALGIRTRAARAGVGGHRHAHSAAAVRGTEPEPGARITVARARRTADRRVALKPCRAATRRAACRVRSLALQARIGLRHAGTAAAVRGADPAAGRRIAAARTRLAAHARVAFEPGSAASHGAAHRRRLRADQPRVGTAVATGRTPAAALVAMLASQGILAAARCQQHQTRKRTESEDKPELHHDLRAPIPGRRRFDHGAPVIFRIRSVCAPVGSAARRRSAS
jgi:hypothetical protein